MSDMDCTTLKGKVGYVLARAPDLTDEDLVLAVWHTFYAHLFDRSGPEPTIAVRDAVRLPDQSRIAAARRRVSDPQVAMVAAAPAEPPWYAR